MTMLGLVGVMSSETSIAGFTVSVVQADTLPEVAEIIEEPAAMEVASPFDPAALLMAATPVDDELQVAEAVRSWVEPSE